MPIVSKRTYRFDVILTEVYPLKIYRTAHLLTMLLLISLSPMCLDLRAILPQRIPVKLY